MKALHTILFIAIAAMFLATQAQAVLFFARPYDPNLQRWLTRDPVGERGGINLYGYVGDNPVNKIDPLGFEGNPISGLGGAWNSNPDGAGGSFYGPGLYYTPPLIQDSGIGNAINNVAQTVNDTLTDQNLWDYLAMDSDNASRLAEPLAAGLGAGIVKLGEKCAAKSATTVLSDVTVISRGKVVGRGDVYLRSTLEGIESGKISPRNIYRNDQGLLPPNPLNYYEEFFHPTPGFMGTGPERIVRGGSGELYYTPDHYNSFIPLN